MINRLSMLNVTPNNYASKKVSNAQGNTTNVIQLNSNKVDASKLASAYRGYNNIKLASSLAFCGGSLTETFDELNKSMITCQDAEHGRKGEVVGSRIGVTTLLSKFDDNLKKVDDAIKTTIVVNEAQDKETGEKIITDARTQIKKGEGKDVAFEMVVRQPRLESQPVDKKAPSKQKIKITLEPYYVGHDEQHRRCIKGTEESAYVLNTRGELMAVVDDNGENILLTNAGTLTRKNGATLEVKASKQDNKEYRTFTVHDIPAVRHREGGSLGGGTELIIGLEEGRFEKEIIDSIAEFCRKVDEDEIVLDRFEPVKNAQNTQILMLAGGYGSRAEYTNASSTKIFHGSNLTKGCFRTATGLTPMETTFISLHKAGLLDCSKGNLGIGKNIKFYLNDSGQNTGNGGFTVDMYDTMEREGRENLLILPNDAMSRIPKALTEMTKIMDSGKAAIVMVAKEVKQEDAAGKLGIMKITNDGLISEFAEKPKTIPEGYAGENGMCYANTFQFIVSKEAFDALESLEEYLPKNGKNKEPRDWSKTFTPILMAITQNDDMEKAKQQIEEKTKISIETQALEKAKEILHGQQIYAVKTDEPWADCGTLNALYYTTMEIANGDFPLEDFERVNVINAVNTQTGLVASCLQQKAEIEKKYTIKGQVMAVPKPKPVPESIISEYSSAITSYKQKHKQKQKQKQV